LKRITFVYIFIAIFLLPIGAHAALWDRGGGLIYDDVLDITWLQDANYAGEYLTWPEAQNWVGNLTYYDSVRDVTWDNWRLPSLLPIDGSSYNDAVSYDGSTDRAFNVSAPESAYPDSTNSEMAYLYYNSLGNLAYYPIDYPDSPAPQADWGLQNTNTFSNIQSDPGRIYWSENEVMTDWVGVFGFDSGIQGRASLVSDAHAAVWAVMDGDVAAVPIPGAVWLLGSGLVSLMGIRRRMTK